MEDFNIEEKIAEIDKILIQPLIKHADGETFEGSLVTAISTTYQ